MVRIIDVPAMFAGNQPVTKVYRGMQQVWPAVVTAGSLNLPREPWYGGPSYYSQFPAAANYGWTNPAYFPFTMSSNSFIGDTEVAWDALSASAYHTASPWSTWTSMESSHMSWIGGALETVPQLPDGTMPESYPGWVGHTITDEIDGLYENATEGLAAISSEAAAFNKAAGRFTFVNYTQRVLQTLWTKPGGGYWGQDFVNHPDVDVVCMDMYWYTIPDASYGNSYVPGGDAVPGPGARQAGSYGSSIRALRWLDAQDGHYKPIWMYIENLSGSPGEQFVRYIEPHELKAAVMSCITNGASGIVWFNTVASVSNGVGNVSRTAQTEPTHVAASRVQAAQEIKTFVESLAPVLNTQSYVWDFGASTIDTMLKTHNGYAYIFAIPGTGGGSGPTLGSKTFQLPAGVSGPIEVIGESRIITPTGTTFTDNFDFEYTWHVYRIALG